MGSYGGYKPSYSFKGNLYRVSTPFITGRGPLCRDLKGFLEPPGDSLICYSTGHDPGFLGEGPEF